MSSSGAKARVLLIGSHRHDGTAYPSAGQQLGALLRRAGHEVLLTTYETRPLAKLLDILATIRRRRDQFDVAVIEVYSTRAFAYARAASRRAARQGKRIVLWLHGGGLPTLARRRPGRVRRLLARAERIVAPSPFLAREVGARLGFAVDVVPNALDVDAIPHRVRGPLAPRLLWVRAFERHYRPAQAVEVLARVRARHPEATLVMAGPDKDGSLAVTQRRADALGVREAVRLLGLVPHEEVLRLGEAADIFLNTTTIDNAPRSVVEAQALGLCVVSTDAGGLRDLLADGEDALLVPAKDAAAMAEAVERLLDDRVLARRLSAGARAVAERASEGAVLSAWGRLLAPPGRSSA